VINIKEAQCVAKGLTGYDKKMVDELIVENQRLSKLVMAMREYIEWLRKLTTWVKGNPEEQELRTRIEELEGKEGG
jgi:hypothetical protein